MIYLLCIGGWILAGLISVIYGFYDEREYIIKYELLELLGIVSLGGISLFFCIADIWYKLSIKNILNITIKNPFYKRKQLNG